jgi:hypothetical protein
MLSLSLFLSRSLLVPMVTVAVAVALAVGSAGCTKAGRSLLQVQVALDSRVTGVTKVEIVVTPIGGGAPTHEEFTGLDLTTPQTLGVFLDSSITGSVGVQANGYMGSGSTVVASSTSVVTMVVPGKASGPVMVTLTPATPGSGSGGAGTGGAAGAGAAGGNSGGAGGTAGAAGTPGGSGGVAGTPGGSGGAAGGASGAGGAGASGGAGGKPAGGKAWQGAMLAENNDLQQDTLPAIAVDSNGNAVVVYEHGYVLWSNYYSAATGTWGTPGPVDARADSEATWASVAVDKNGKYLAVWQQAYDNSIHGIWQATSTDGVHWSEPAAIATTGMLFTPYMAMNDDGIAGVVWVENLGANINYFQLSGSVRAANGTWSAPHVLKASTDTGDRNPAIVVTGQGDVVVAWEQPDDRAVSAAKTSIWMERYTGGAWGSPSLVESYDANWAGYADLATNKAGQIVVTWVQYVNSDELWSRRYPASGMPDPPVRIGEPADIGTAPAPSVALDDAGNATVAMAITTKTRVQAYTSRAAWGQAWSAPMAMETDNQAGYDNLDAFEYAISPHVARDATGNVYLIWRKRVDTGVDSKMKTLFRWDLWSRIYDVGSNTWGPATPLEMRDMNTMNPPQTTSVFGEKISVNASGVAGVAWYFGYDLDVWANIYR